jgi:hypothetical protein
MNLVKIKIGTYTALVDASIAGNLQRADSAMFAVTGKHILITYSYRSTLLQAKLYAERTPGQRVAPPGKSFHEKGLAIDVSNWKDAQQFLHKEGFKNDLADDRGHFSIGEFGRAASAVRVSLLALAAGALYLLSRRWV